MNFVSYIGNIRPNPIGEAFYFLFCSYRLFGIIVIILATLHFSIVMIGNKRQLTPAQTELKRKRIRAYFIGVILYVLGVVFFYESAVFLSILFDPFFNLNKGN